MNPKTSKKDYLNSLTEPEGFFLKSIKESINLDLFEVKNIWQEDFASELELFDSVYSLFVYFLKAVQAKTGLTRFDEAFLILGSKMLSDAQSIRLCTENGWTGTALGISRMFHSSNCMILFLGYYPEHLELWFSEKHDSYQKGKDFRVFLETEIIKKLTEKGFECTKLSFQLLSKVAHASYWGSQVYTDSGNVTFHPRPDFFKTLLLLAEIPGTISALINWYLGQFPNTLVEYFETNKVEDIFVKLHASLNQACGQLMNRVVGFIIKTQDAREKQGGPLLQRIEHDEWQSIQDGNSKKIDPPL